MPEIHVSNERNMFVAENFIRSLVDKYSLLAFYTDGVVWYPQTCRFIQLKRRSYSLLEEESDRKSDAIF